MSANAGSGSSNGFSIIDFFKKIFGFGDNSSSQTNNDSTPSSNPDNTSTQTRPAAQNGTTKAYVLGDSLGVQAASGLKLTGQFSDVVNEAKVGAHVSEITQAQIASVAPGSTCYISIGTNDVDGRHGWTQKEVDDYVKKVMDKAQQVKDRGANVVMIGMQPPSKDYNGNKKDVWDANIEMVNRTMKAEAEKRGIAYQSFENFGFHADDGVHLSADGSKKMGQVLAGISTPGTNA
jgi:lysophospholipase L1-like esterase